LLAELTAWKSPVIGSEHGRIEHIIRRACAARRGPLEAVFVTSANLTEAAPDRNVELGLLVRDRALAASVLSRFQGLIHSGRLHPLPMA
jgi:phosphatidylserine/phosphatidylglycerophosphate/cardiolipin synthase-like enzyme